MDRGDPPTIARGRRGAGRVVGLGDGASAPRSEARAKRARPDSPRASDREVKLRLHAKASQELEAAMNWYDDQQPGLGAELVVEVNRVLDIISNMPRAAPIWPDLEDEPVEIRRVTMSRFPYSIAYEVHPDEVVILAFAHHKR